MPAESPKEKVKKPRGELYLVATPIGNLEDITLRALRILKEVDLIACEDTRQTRKLLSHFEIHRPLESYHQHNETTRGAELLARLKDGAKIALVSDAGTPLISDPGHHLVSLCLENGINVVPIPGASAITVALAASGIESSQFIFVGFLPPRSGQRRKHLEQLAIESRTIVLYEAPHRLLAMLTDACEILGDRAAVVARELTKLHEEFHRGRLSELIDQFTGRPPRGEITVIIAPPNHQEAAHQNAAQPHTGTAATVSIAKRVSQIMESAGLDQKAALKQAARERGITKRAAYKLLLAAR